MPSVVGSWLLIEAHGLECVLIIEVLNHVSVCRTKYTKSLQRAYLFVRTIDLQDQMSESCEPMIVDHLPDAAGLGVPCSNLAIYRKMNPFAS